ncbi:MAG: translation elongation factor Ts [Lewinella sp.]|jgi:elongation factor Ts|uniref:translation elongation factor Ts n=1 Tax=Lewinella sp. TaxID=2004506 RepID=UPI003D6C57D3
MSVTAADIKKLRDMTGAGMMDCKKALNESAGDFDKAIEVLRLKGQKVSAKRADNEANEGAVIALVSEDKTRGVIVKLSSETDFVSKNQEFVDGVNAIAEAALKAFPASKEELMDAATANGTVASALNDLVTKFTEKMELSYERLEAAVVAPYIHMGNKAGVIVGLSAAGDAAYEAGRDVAMQVAAMKPVAVDKDGVDQSIIDKEIEIGIELARKEGKPEAMLDKIAKGKLNKFFKDNTLLNQAFVKDSKQNIAGYLNSVEKGLTVTDFKHVTLG